MSVRFTGISRIILAAIAPLLLMLLTKEQQHLVSWILLIGLIYLPVSSFLIKKAETPKENSLIQLSEAALIISIYYSTSQLQPTIIEHKDPWFYGLMFAELALNVYGIRKFKMPQQKHPQLTALFALLTMAWMVLVCFTSQDRYFIPVLIFGLLAYTDHLLIIFWMPFYHPEIRNSLQAWRYRSNYRKTLNIK